MEEGLDMESNAALLWTGVSHFTTDESRSIDFITGKHHLWAVDILSGSIFSTCEKNGGKWKKKLHGPVP